ncbi:MAG: hypothetical protein NT086_19880 [Proteobacteria bacterium]|nr:hypothetical protein [Pseudomonadota bacterium]
MKKVTAITKQMGFSLNPITINGDLSISVGVSIGVIADDGTLVGGGLNNHYIQPAESIVALSGLPLKDETVLDALTRSVGDVLKAKGLLPA